MSQERLYTLIAKVLSKEATPSEITDFHSLISNNDEWKSVFLNLEELWNNPPISAQLPTTLEDKYFLHLARLKEQSGDFEEYTKVRLVKNEMDVLSEFYTKRVWYKKWQSIAAVLTIFIISAFVFKYIRFSNPETDLFAQKGHLNEIKVSLGTKTKVNLPDGSLVWVNSDSKLAYTETFSGPTRDIYLEGEAYFDVVKDRRHPFIVHTSGINIKVLGTAFNVKAYKSESTIEATLVHGLIEVTKTNQSDAATILLHPHEKLIFVKNVNTESVVKSFDDSKKSMLSNNSVLSPSITISPLHKNIADTAIIETSWVYNRLSFEDEKFANLAMKIERWFDVKIMIENDKIRSYRTTGSFENETIEEALIELQYLVPFNYRINGREIIITK